MPYNGSGTFSRLYSWVTDAANSINISSSRTDAEMNGFAAGLTNCVTRDGQSPPSADLPMGGKKLTGLGAATVGTDALNMATADLRYSPFASPAFTGTPTAPTAAGGTNTTQLATTAFVTTAVNAVYASPTFTGTVTVPTPTTADNTTKAASTAYVQANLASYAPLASPTFTGTPAAPTATAGTSTTQLATTAFVDVLRDIPQNAQAGAYALVLTDRGKHISITTGGITIPANASVAFPIGATIGIYNNSGSNQSIAITTDTMFVAGTASTGTRTLAQHGFATLVKVAATTWIITGAGLT